MSDKKNGFHARTGFFVCSTCGQRFTCSWGASPTKCAGCLTKEEQDEKIAKLPDSC